MIKTYFCHPPILTPKVQDAFVQVHFPVAPTSSRLAFLVDFRQVKC